ncbi:MAG: M14 family metallopeptidase [Wenzhouxiangellaceae bacterium]
MALFLGLGIGAAQSAPLTDFVGADAALNEELPRPDKFLGFEPGEQHVRHQQLVDYLRTLAEQSPRISVQTIGATHEQRPLIHLYITSPANQQRLEELRQQHLDGAGPLVVWQGYSIHGNEASGSNVAPLVAWYLAASQEDWIESLLDNTIIILDPSYNPDGLDRFAQWTNSQAGVRPSADSNDWEHSEPWPNGRTNHYWFDLNRDWLPLVHPESRARVAQFQRWRPHILTDHHEMGSNSTFFFQPGVPERTNPLTAARNQQLTDALGAFHARALDQAGELYFTREIFDDFYYGKGSTYPDAQGSIGILFEQASVRGKRINTSYGERSFADSMLNQFRTSLSTLRGADHHRQDFIDYRREHDAAMADWDDNGAWVLGDDGDRQRANQFIDILLQHQIKVYPLERDVKIDDQSFRSGYAWVIPQRQPQAALVAAVFSQLREFEDNTFYDVSAWTLPLAYDLPFGQSERVPDHGAALTAVPPPATASAASNAAEIALVIPWNQLHAPALLHELLQEEIKVQVASQPFQAQADGQQRQFAAGDLIIPIGIQKQDRNQLHQWLRQVTASRPLRWHAVAQARTISGPDLGSSSFNAARPVRPLLVVGYGVSPYDAGEVWHLLDQRLGMTPTRVEWYRLAAVPLDQYTHLLMVDGDYSQIGPVVQQRIVDWVGRGGHLVLSESANLWADALPWGAAAESEPASGPAEDNQEPPPARRAYGDFQADFARGIIGGAIMQLMVDTSHPLAYGLQRGQLPVMKSNLLVLEQPATAYSTVASYAEDPLMAGYTSADNQQKLAGKPAVTADVWGQGRVIRFADNTQFRGHWLGASRLYLNALFFSHLIQPTVLPQAPR